MQNKIDDAIVPIAKRTQEKLTSCDISSLFLLYLEKKLY